MADKSFYLPTDERRQATRFKKEPGTEFVVLSDPAGQEFTAEVQDESLGGLAVLLPASVDFAIGVQLQLLYAGDLMRAVVRHREPLPDGRLRVGLECQ